MCYAVSCSTCGKITWGGCGRHVGSVHKQIDAGQHCMCRPWPGVKLEGSSPPADDTAVLSTGEQASKALCVIQ